MVLLTGSFVNARTNQTTKGFVIVHANRDGNIANGIQVIEKKCISRIIF